MSWGRNQQHENYHNPKSQEFLAKKAEGHTIADSQKKDEGDMSDDLDKLVRTDLPKLAYSIASSGPRRMKSKAHFSNRPNRVA